MRFLTLTLTLNFVFGSLCLSGLLLACAPKAKEKKIIWEFSGGYTYTTSDSVDRFDTHIHKSTATSVEAGCSELESHSIDEYIKNGWHISNIRDADKNVDGGSCRGREALLDR